METLKRLFAVAFLILLTNSAIAQSANYEKLREAFKTSYEKEAFEKWDAAIEPLIKAYVEDSYECNLRLGWLYYSAANHTESQKYYKKAIDLKPFSIEAKFGLIYPEYALGNMQKVIYLYNEILTAAPNNTQALYQLGTVYFYAGEYDRAAKLYSKVVDLFPFGYDALIMLAHTNYHLKKFREAKVLYNKVLLYNPEDAAALESLKLLE
ncbi:tetratricopeptide repeat protein [Labilibacter marinus]|uniref:tetratricopeptide repeat protein n=1 Tax=Labilibacter marinus TaxID=1477105 RepID=UPI0009F8D282|nr:tetratricopeptide repeat protein [Labilibacter marinus]